MAEGRGDSSYPSPLEEQYFREAEEEDGDLDQQMVRERELASQRLWLAFQDSATAVAHLFRDCQQQAGLAAWVPFHESASAVTQLYRGSSEICKQCMECGTKYGQRKKTRDVIAWAKKKRRTIKREELLAFLLDKPYPDPSSDHSDDITTASPHSRATPTIVSGLGFAPMQTSHYSSPLPSPRRRTLFREDSSGGLGEDVYSSVRENGRKRPSASSNSIQFDFSPETPLPKRMRL